MAETTAVPVTGRYDRYVQAVLRQLTEGSGARDRSDSQIKNDLVRLIRPAYDRAVLERRRRSGEMNAAIDTDAAGRGMGTSTWVADAKQRQRAGEAADVAAINGEYLSALYEALLERIGERDRQRLERMSAAKSAAGRMYDRWKREEDALAVAAGGGAAGDEEGTDGGGRRPGRSRAPEAPAAPDTLPATAAPQRPAADGTLSGKAVFRPTSMNAKTLNRRTRGTR